MQSLPRVVAVIVESNDSVLLFEFVPYERLVPSVGFNVVLRFSPVIVFKAFAALLICILSAVATEVISSVFLVKSTSMVVELFAVVNLIPSPSSKDGIPPEKLSACNVPVSGYSTAHLGQSEGPVLCCPNSVQMERYN